MSPTRTSSFEAAYATESHRTSSQSLSLPTSYQQPPAAARNITSLLPNHVQGPRMINAASLSITQIHCLQLHRRWRPSKNNHASLACALCHIDRDQLSSDSDDSVSSGGNGDRWSCLWCALRVCTACRSKVEESMGRDPSKALVGNEVVRPPPPAVMLRPPSLISARSFGQGQRDMDFPLAPPPNVFANMGGGVMPLGTGMGARGWGSTSDLTNLRDSGRGSASQSRRESVGTLPGRRTHMSQVTNMEVGM